MKTLVKGNSSPQKNDPIDQYLTLDHPSTENSSEPMISEQDENSFPQPAFESPFQEEDSLDFLILPNRGSSQKSWLFATIFTIIIAVFVVPESSSSVVIGISFLILANQVNDSTAQAVPFFEHIWVYTKIVAKYLVVFAYAAFMYSLIAKKYFKKKRKSI